MVTEIRTYFTEEKITKKFLDDSQIAADREEALVIGREGCNDCVLTGHLNIGELVIECASRKFDTLEKAVNQEFVCSIAHDKVLESIDGQAEIYLQDI